MAAYAGWRRNLLRLLRILGAVLAWLVVSLLLVWGAAALWFDVRTGWLKYVAAAVYALALLASLFLIKRSALRLAACMACFLAVLCWWLSLEPSNTRDWQPDVSRTAWAEVHADHVVIHDVRNCDYRAEHDFTCRWETRSYDLSQLRGSDVFIVYWGSPWIAHTIVSFEFANSDPIAFSIETRKVTGQSYSALLGFFRQYTLIYIASDERDVVRLRTNYRHGAAGQGEDVYLYHLRADPLRARARFLEYIQRINELHAHPEWYNALTKNCTTSIFAQREATPGAVPALSEWDWRVLLNGKLDGMAYERGAFAGNLPFDELKRRAYINPVARAAGDDPAFSRIIREGRPGFEDLQEEAAPDR
jgi:hypothetical protein